MKQTIKIKRVYERRLKKDGYRVLVDRVWPRGLTKEEVSFDEWAKDLAPSPKLRKWFGHDPELWTEFQKMYKAELKKNKAVEDFLVKSEDQKTITLIYSAKDPQHNHAVALQQFLEKCLLFE